MHSSGSRINLGSLFNRAVTLHQEGKIAEAVKAYEQILLIQPAHFDALHFLGLCHYQYGHHDSAVQLIGKALRINPKSCAAHNNMGSAQKSLKRYTEALASYDRAIALKRDYAEAHFNRANTLQEAGRLEEALKAYDKTIALKPDYAEAHSNRGNTLQKLKRFDEALSSYSTAIAIRPAYFSAISNKGVVLQRLGFFDQALESYSLALKIRPDYAEALNNAGSALEQRHRFDEALSCYARAIALNPEYAQAHWNESTCRLLMGDYAAGWKAFEWRWRTDDQKDRARNFALPLWLGSEDIKGKTILLHAEQGLGDTIQFCRYASAIAEKGARVILEVPRMLKSLLATLAGPSLLIARGEEIPDCDYHCPLLSLPLALGTSLSNVPANIPYLGVDQERAERWRQLLGQKRKLRIGLAWSGSAAHKNDHNRSLPLSSLMASFKTIDAEFFGLQKEIGTADRVTLLEDGRIQDFSDRLDDFSDTAALISMMDVVVSVDTSVAHLAGALGTPLFVLLAYVPDWRWLLNRNDSPWYPTARLLRQSSHGDWDSVCGQLAPGLHETMADPRIQ